MDKSITNITDKELLFPVMCNHIKQPNKDASNNGFWCVETPWINSASVTHQLHLLVQALLCSVDKVKVRILIRVWRLVTSIVLSVTAFKSQESPYLLINSFLPASVSVLSSYGGLLCHTCT